MGEVRVAAIASLTPLEELDGDPFLVDTRSQQAMCARWAEDRGYVVTRQLRVYGLRPDHYALWSDVEGGEVDMFVAPNDRVLARAVVSVLALAGLDEPQYNARSKAGVHRRLSMPTAGYDGR